MIKSFSFKNYKAFKEGKIEIRPITILLGANSVGKSSILQFLSMVKQTVCTEKKYKSALKLNGENVSLGENKNIFHNKNTNIPLGFSFEIENFDITMVKMELEKAIEDMLMVFERIESFISDEVRQIYRSRRIGHQDKVNYNMLIDRIQSLKTTINNKLKKRNKSEDDIENLLIRMIGHSRYRNNIIDIYSKDKKKIILDLSHYRKAYYLLKSLNSFSGKPVTLSYEIVEKNKELKISEIAIKKGDKNILTYISKKAGNKKHELSSDFIDNLDIAKYSSKFGNSINLEKLNIFSIIQKTKGNSDLFGSQKRIIEIRKIYKNIFLETIFKIYKGNINSCWSNFSGGGLNYVSPLRAFPKRYYFLDTSNVTSSLNSIDGNQLTEILKENKIIKNKVNNWLERFNLKVDTKQLADVIHNIKVTQHGLDLDITDVGFGLSQILPVIVQGFLSQPNSLTIIEQPEIHLHPKMQAELGDLFIDIVQTKTPEYGLKNLIIETHSEYLLKRIRRRIAEEKILAKDVAIYFINPKAGKNESGRIEEIEISDTGNFERPRDFYSTDLEDTIEFLKHQK